MTCFGFLLGITVYLHIKMLTLYIKFIRFVSIFLTFSLAIGIGGLDSKLKANKIKAMYD